MVEVLKQERGLNVHRKLLNTYLFFSAFFPSNISACNRLDRLTSGLMFLARNPKSADKMGQQLRGREVSKEYLARVVGEFPT